MERGFNAGQTHIPIYLQPFTSYSELKILWMWWIFWTLNQSGSSCAQCRCLVWNAIKLLWDDPGVCSLADKIISLRRSVVHCRLELSAFVISRIGEYTSQSQKSYFEFQQYRAGLMRREGKDITHRKNGYETRDAQCSGSDVETTLLSVHFVDVSARHSCNDWSTVFDRRTWDFIAFTVLSLKSQERYGHNTRLRVRTSLVRVSYDEFTARTSVWHGIKLTRYS